MAEFITVGDHILNLDYVMCVERREVEDPYGLVVNITLVDGTKIEEMVDRIDVSDLFAKWRG